MELIRNTELPTQKHFTAVILAAGQGTRLRPLTDDRPKCMVEVAGASILSRQIATLKACGIQNIVIVGGYLHEKLPTDGVIKVVNHEFAETNMIYSLHCAKDHLKGHVIVSYGDIFFDEKVLQKLMASPYDIAIASDQLWEQYWEKRFAEPLSDAETFAIHPATAQVLSLGQKPKSRSEIQGQFIGLLKFSETGIQQFQTAYNACAADESCKANAWHSGRPLEKAYMTDILNDLAGQGVLYFEPIDRGWFEIDDVDDLRVAERELQFFQDL
ncbi:MAG: phosphocholine cytidylyltransferase family protein [Schleiferiaceae bacterium]|nr:phosphocholine cytidylyltransferase family protein [Schleiferiaceae bacterium]